MMIRQDLIKSAQARALHHAGIIALASGPKSGWTGRAEACSFFFGGRDRRSKVIKHQRALMAEAEAELAALRD